MCVWHAHASSKHAVDAHTRMFSICIHIGSALTIAKRNASFIFSGSPHLNLFQCISCSRRREHLRAIAIQIAAVTAFSEA